MPSPVGGFSFEGLAKMVDDLRTMHANYSAGIAAIEQALNVFESVKQGSPGMPGQPGRNVTEAEVNAAVKRYVIQPKDGVSPTPEIIAQAVIDAKAFRGVIKKYLKENMPESAKQDKLQAELIIAQALIAFKKEQFDINQIKGLDGRIKEIRNHVALQGKVYGKDTWARGGGDTVEAGTNVTIQNVNGKKRISATAGFTVLTATGAINGVNLIYTFTQVPTLIAADGVLLPATGAGGTVFWTHVGTTVTMVNPPAFDIYGVA